MAGQKEVFSFWPTFFRGLYGTSLVGKALAAWLRSFSGDPKKLVALNKIPEILEQMSLVSSMPDKGNNLNVLKVIKAKAILEIEGEKHIFNVTLKHMKSNNSFLFYDLSTHLIK